MEKQQGGKSNSQLFGNTFVHKECTSGGKAYLHFAIQSNKIMLYLNLMFLKNKRGEKMLFSFWVAAFLNIIGGFSYVAWSG